MKRERKPWHNANVYNFGWNSEAVIWADNKKKAVKIFKERFKISSLKDVDITKYDIFYSEIPCRKFDKDGVYTGKNFDEGK